MADATERREGMLVQPRPANDSGDDARAPEQGDLPVQPEVLGLQLLVAAGQREHAAGPATLDGCSEHGRTDATRRQSEHPDAAGSKIQTGGYDARRADLLAPAPGCRGRRGRERTGRHDGNWCQRGSGPAVYRAAAPAGAEHHGNRSHGRTISLNGTDVYAAGQEVRS
jgi:hypothetical protein